MFSASIGTATLFKVNPHKHVYMDVHTCSMHPHASFLSEPPPPPVQELFQGGCLEFTRDCCSIHDCNPDKVHSSRVECGTWVMQPVRLQVSVDCWLLCLWRGDTEIMRQEVVSRHLNLPPLRSLSYIYISASSVSSGRGRLSCFCRSFFYCTWIAHKGFCCDLLWT